MSQQAIKKVAGCPTVGQYKNDTCIQIRSISFRFLKVYSVSLTFTSGKEKAHEGRSEQGRVPCVTSELRPVRCHAEAA